MTAKNNTEIDFKALQTELVEINSWFESQNDIDPKTALDKYRRSVEIVKHMKSYLTEVENEFKVISQELDNEK